MSLGKEKRINTPSTVRGWRDAAKADAIAKSSAPLLGSGVFTKFNSSTGGNNVTVGGGGKKQANCAADSASSGPDGHSWLLEPHIPLSSWHGRQLLNRLPASMPDGEPGVKKNFKLVHEGKSTLEYGEQSPRACLSNNMPCSHRLMACFADTEPTSLAVVCGSPPQFSSSTRRAEAPHVLCERHKIHYMAHPPSSGAPSGFPLVICVQFEQ